MTGRELLDEKLKHIGATKSQRNSPLIDYMLSIFTEDCAPNALECLKAKRRNVRLPKGHTWQRKTDAMDLSGNTGSITTPTDESCFKVSDIAKYLEKSFRGQQDVPLSELYDLLDKHPIFPSDGYKTEIKDHLKTTYNATISAKPDPITGKKKTCVSFRKGGPK